MSPNQSDETKCENILIEHFGVPQYYTETDTLRISPIYADLDFGVGIIIYYH